MHKMCTSTHNMADPTIFIGGDLNKVDHRCMVK